ncbi:MAG: OmpA family protein [Leptolyngbya sp. DLM2.Bin27]|nr:MAG: OmpA family protein [Leptolyngbya sp. DLM2.Bin27]
MADSPDLPPLSSEPALPEVSSPVPAAPPAPQRRSGIVAGLHAFWTLVVRLMILGAGVSLGGLAGMLVAQALPARNPTPPLTEIALRQGSQTVGKLRQLPRWWRGGNTTTVGPTGGAVAVEALTPDAAGDAADADAAATEPPPLTDADRDRMQADLTRLQQDLASLDARLGDLESSLGAAPSGTVEDRLQQLDQRLAPAPEPEAEPETEPDPDAEGNVAPPTPAPTARVPYPDPRFALVSDRIVLPSALLFEPGSSILTSPGQQLLDSIAPDLGRYGAATLLVGSHTDGTAAPDQAAQLTLQQSLAVQQHLAPQVEVSGLRWVAVGYGQTRPSPAGTTPGDQRRNQRVEIGIVPRN